MNERNLKRLMKRDRSRRRAQGIGALAGVLTSVFAIGLLYGEGILKSVDRLADRLEKKDEAREGERTER